MATSPSEFSPEEQALIDRADSRKAAFMAPQPAQEDFSPEEMALIQRADERQKATIASAKPAKVEPKPKGKAFLHGVARGVSDVFDTAGKVLDVPAGWLEAGYNKVTGGNGLTMGGMFPTVAQAQQNRLTAQQQYEHEYGDSGAATLGRVAGQTLATAPVMGPLGRALTSEGSVVTAGLGRLAQGGPIDRAISHAVQGAAMGGIAAGMTSGGNSEPAGAQVASGALIGGALGPVAPYVVNALTGAVNTGAQLVRGAGRLGNALIGRAPVAANEAEAAAVQSAGQGAAAELAKSGINPATIDDASNAATAEMLVRKIRSGEPVDAPAIARKANAESLGLVMHDSMLTRDPNQWANERYLADLGTKAGNNALKSDYLHNERVIKQHLSDFRDSTGGVTTSAPDAGESVMDAIKAKWGETQKAVGDLYKQVRDQKGGDFGMVPENVLHAMKMAEESVDGEKAVKPMMVFLKRMGAVDAEGNIASAGPNSQKAMTIQQAEELRKKAGEISAHHDPNLARLGSSFVDAVDQDVIEGANDDAFKVARDAARQRFQEFKGPQNDSRFHKPLADVVNNKVAPDTYVERMVLSKAAPRDAVENLRNSLLSGTPEQIARGQDAWNNVRGRVMHSILEKATNGNVEDGAISYAKLKVALNSVGDDKLRILFGEDGLSRLKSILKGAHDTMHEPSGAPVNRSHTAVTLENRLTQLAGKDEGNPLLNTAAGLAAAHVPFAAPAIGAARVVGQRAAQQLKARQLDEAIAAARGGGAGASPMGLLISPSQAQVAGNLLQRGSIPLAVSGNKLMQKQEANQ